MKKKIIKLPPGTFIDTGSLILGKEASFLLPNGSIMKTSPIERKFLAGNFVTVETQNSVYCTHAVTAHNSVEDNHLGF